MGLLSSINILWLGSAFALTIISLNVFKGDPSSEDGLPYILFNTLYFLLVIIMERADKINKERLHISVFIVGVLTILVSQPIHENDHYRYLWEGRVLLSGENPYVSQPNSKELDEVEFDARGKIGFPELTTVYPPLSLLWFGGGGILSSKHRVGLIFLMLLNALLIYLVFMRLQDLVGEKWLLILLFPFFQKEFIQSIHVDLFSFFWAFLFLTGYKASFFRSSLFVFLSIFTKIIGVFFVWPLCLNYLKSHKKNVSYWLTLIFLIISFPLFYLLLERIGGTSGFKAFSGDWVWNPGFYSFLWRGLDFLDHQARLFSIAMFLIYCSVLGFWSLYWFKNRGMILGHKLFWTTSYLFFAGLIFFTPVYNAWYAIWFVVPALLLNLRFGVLYGFFSFTCYVSYWNDNFLPWSEFLGHLFFIPSLFEIYFLNRRETGKVVKGGKSNG